MQSNRRPSIPMLISHQDQFRARLVQDALNEATSAYWLRRAREAAAALAGTEPSDPRLGTPQTRATARASLARMEAEFRRLAELALIDGGIEDVVWEVLAEFDGARPESLNNPAA